MWEMTMVSETPESNALFVAALGMLSYHSFNLVISKSGRVRIYTTDWEYTHPQEIDFASKYLGDDMLHIVSTAIHSYNKSEKETP